MNKYILLFTLLIFAFSSKSQNNRNISVELGGIHTPQESYFTKKYFNYGAYSLLSKHINNFKFSSGLTYINESNYYELNQYSSAGYSIHNLEYISIPLLINYYFNKDKLIIFNVQTGISFNRRIKYCEKLYPINTPSTSITYKVPNDTKIAIKLGFGISKYISKSVCINLSSYFDYIKPNYDPHIRIPNISHIIAFKLGAEYYLNVNL